MYINMDLIQVLSFRLAKETLSVGFEVAFTFFKLESYTRMVFNLVHLELPKTVALEVGLTENVNIALENVTHFIQLLW